MSEHGEHGHLEVYPDSGITETSKPIYGFLWVTCVLMLVFFHGYIANQFWTQQSDLPQWGPGWQAYDPADNWGFGGKPAGRPSTLALNEPALDDKGRVVFNNAADTHVGNYGARR